MTASPRAVIDLTALQHNLAVARRCAAASRVMAVVKANGYGHGLLPVAGALAGADALVVARPEEAYQLRSAGIQQRLILLGTLLDPGLLRECARQAIEIVVHDAESAAQVHSTPALSAPLRAWIKVDTGMHRLGIDPGELQALHRALDARPGIDVVGHMSHLASAELPDPGPTRAQLESLLQARGGLRVPASLANSAGLIAHPDTRLEWVRPGIMLYGDNPVGARFPLELRPVMSLRAPVLALRDLPAGSAVGYCGTWRCRRPSRIATIGIGYGDGYPRHAPSGTPVRLGRDTGHLVGRVSMDSITVDVTDCRDVRVGMEAELWGTGTAVGEIAARAGTISYELLTGVTGRVRRIYQPLPAASR